MPTFGSLNSIGQLQCNKIKTNYIPQSHIQAITEHPTEIHFNFQVSSLTRRRSRI